MAVTVKHTYIRKHIHDVYWFEFLLIEGKLPLEPILLYAERQIYKEFTISQEQVKDLRPDIRNDILKNESLTFTSYDPLSTIAEFIFIFDSLEEFRQINQKVFNEVGDKIQTITKLCENICIEKVYDEQGNFLEDGLLTFD